MSAVGRCSQAIGRPPSPPIQGFRQRWWSYTRIVTTAARVRRRRPPRPGNSDFINIMMTSFARSDPGNRPLRDLIQVTTPAGLAVAVAVSTISCISADDDLTDTTVLLLRDDSVVMVAEAYEDFVDRIVETW